MPHHRSAKLPHGDANQYPDADRHADGHCASISHAHGHGDAVLRHGKWESVRLYLQPRVLEKLGQSLGASQENIEAKLSDILAELDKERKRAQSLEKGLDAVDAGENHPVVFAYVQNSPV